MSMGQRLIVLYIKVNRPFLVTGSLSYIAKWDTKKPNLKTLASAMILRFGGFTLTLALHFVKTAVHRMAQSNGAADMRKWI